MKTIACLLAAFLVLLTAHAQNTQDLGDLTGQSSPLVVQGSLTKSQKQFTYTFNLTAVRVVDVGLSQLSNNANLRLLDSSGATLASSSNSGVANENLEASLNAGDYSILVEKPGQKRVSYTLTVSALPDGSGGFTPQDDVVSGSTSIQDPEFDWMTFHVAWRTSDGRLIVAPVNPATGAFSLDQAVQVDSGLALYDQVVNGPEWSISGVGARILYTKVVNARWQVAQAQFLSGSWQASLVPGTEDCYKPIGNLDPNDALSLMKYALGSQGSRQEGKAWKALVQPYPGAVIPDSEGLEGGRWVPGGESIMFSKLVGNVYQIVNYNVGSGALTTLTSGPDHKLLPFAVRAPDLNNDVIITVSETDENTRGSYKWTGVYRKVGGVWTRIKRIFSPSTGLPAVHSVEPFVFRGKTYVSFLAVKDPDTNPDQRKLGAAVFIASVDPNDDFVREVSAKSETMVRSDPEPFSTDQAAFIYYTELVSGFRKIHRCATGL